nr:LysM peptidoglycan-binding domain-containing protein [Fredinandcohnia onubensis]
MDYYQRYEVRKTNHPNDEYTLVIYLNNNLTEFASELGTVSSARKDILSTARQVLRERYPNIKVTMVKVMLGGMVVASIPLTTNNSSAHAAEPSVSTTQVAQSSNIYYQVSSRDTLWGLSKKFNTSVDAIKRANNLTSDVLKLNQRLIIPKAFHTVDTGDYLTVLAKQYGVTVNAIKEANQMTSDATRLGQTLVIPVLMGSGTSNPAPTVTQEPQTTQTQGSTYTIVAGDSLWGIAQKFGTTVSTLKSANNLTSDALQIGQTLTLPTGGDAVTSPTPEPTPIPTPSVTETSHTVVAGDTLWGIASRYGTTVNVLKQANQLSSNLLSLGQTLTIPSGSVETPMGNTETPTTEEKRTTFKYSVRSGDSLSVIANRFGVTVDAIRTANGLTSDTIRVGQLLTIPDGTNAPTQTATNTITYTTHTVVSGDNIWNLSVKYGIPQGELLRANNLTTSSMLSIGQKLTIPVHNIAVKEVVSERHGEYLDWWTEAQYVFPINKTAKVTDFATGKSFYIKRTIGANHADSETLTTNDSTIAKSIWGGYSWTPRAVILEIDGRKVAASMSFMPHEREYISGNGITGHFDVYFGNSTRHVDGNADASHQRQVEIAAGIR